MARISGPVEGGAKGWAFGVPVVDLDAVGYLQEEFFLEGEAVRYTAVGQLPLGFDGRWEVEAGESAPYKTRIVVLRPKDPERFNGTALTLWNNVTAGYENFGGGDGDEFFEGGYACVAVSAQRAGVHGAGDNPQGLRNWDPERYGSLSIPSDDFSYDIFTQAAEAVAPDRSPGAVDPLGGLEVTKLVAQGASQSAARLSTYLNAVQPLTGRFDAFFLLMYFGGSTPLEVGDALMTLQAGVSEADQPAIPEGEHLLRDDLAVRIFVVNTECEAMSCYPVRQPDTDHFRYWEVAGASHVSLPALASSLPRLERDFGFAIPIDDSLRGINQVSIAPVVDAALHHLQNWISEDTPPPVQPRIEFTGEPPEVARDADRMALGGVRLPWIEVPTGHNSAIQRTPDVFARLVGSHDAFSDEELRHRYPSRKEYLAEFEQATRAALSASVILPRDVGPLITEASGAFPS